jgi:exonuclease III
MRITTLNIQHGGGQRVNRLIGMLAELGGDVILLTEFRENSNARAFKTRLFAWGYQWQASTSIDPKQNGAFLAAKVPFVSISRHAALAAHAHRLLFAQFAHFNLIGVYFPLMEEKRPVFEYLTSHLVSHLGESGLVLGDFNTGKPYTDEAGKTFSCVDCFHALESSGLVDSWRSRNPEAREFSWFSGAKNGFRIDHVFCTPKLDRRVTKVVYVHRPREEGVTDHSAMIVEFDGEGSA